MTPSRIFRFCRPMILAWLLCESAWGHDPFESTVVSRLQHGRLEVEVTLTTEMARLLVESNPENVEANSEEAFLDMERLKQRALTLYQVSDGTAALVPQRAVVNSRSDGHIEVTLIFPPPTKWPMKIRARPIERVPSSYFASVEVFDEADQLLARKVMNQRDPANLELSIASNTPVVSTPEPIRITTVPTSPPATGHAASPRWPLLELGIAVAGGSAAIGLAVWMFRNRSESHHENLHR